MDCAAILEKSSGLKRFLRDVEFKHGSGHFLQKCCCASQVCALFHGYLPTLPISGCGGWHLRSPARLLHDPQFDSDDDVKPIVIA